MKKELLFLAIASVMAGCGREATETKKQVPVVETTVAIKTRPLLAASQIGVIEESQSLSLSFRTAGSVSAVYAKEGGFVNKGQLLAEIDKESLQSAYDAASSTLEQAEDAMDRMEKLYNAGALPEIQWIEVQSKVQTARSMEVMARKSLEAAQLKAPAPGLIIQRSIETGENVMPGVSVFKLVDIDRVDAVFAVSEEIVADIHEGDPVKVILKTTGDEYEGKVISRKLKGDILSHTFDVRVSIANPGHELLPGMICKAQLASTGSEESIVIPQQAVLLNYDNSRFVWTVSEGKACLTPVMTGKAVNGGVEILSGLTEGNVVVVKGMQKISEGMTVKSVAK